ncbi:hypothetical protein KW783_03605 [Candidatus Parcubacteria bacterium]|nr:hypothetical protein [Candidatus Parcubacteria bacterium]
MNESKSLGPVIGSIIIIVVIVLGGLYFWGKTLQNKTAGEPVTASNNATVSSAVAQNGDAATIEAGITASDGSDVDVNVQNIETDFQ